MYVGRCLPPPIVGGGQCIRAFWRTASLCFAALSVVGSSLGCGIVPATLQPDERQPNAVALLLRTADGSATANAPIQPASALDMLYDTTRSELTLGGLSLRLAPVSLDVEGGVHVDVAETTASLDLSGGLPMAPVDSAGNFQVELNLVAATAVTIEGVTIPFVHTTGGPAQGHIEYDPAGGSMAVALEGTELVRFLLFWGPDLLVLTGDITANFSNPG